MSVSKCKLRQAAIAFCVLAWITFTYNPHSEAKSYEDRSGPFDQKACTKAVRAYQKAVAEAVPAAVLYLEELKRAYKGMKRVKRASSLERTLKAVLKDNTITESEVKKLMRQELGLDSAAEKTHLLEIRLRNFSRLHSKSADKRNLMEVQCKD